MSLIRFKWIFGIAFCILSGCTSQHKNTDPLQSNDASQQPMSAEFIDGVSKIDCRRYGWSSCLQIYTVNVGQGNSSLIKLPSGKFILIDAGGSSKGLDRLKQVVNHVVNTKKIDTIVLSSSDRDHSGWINEIPQAQTPRSVHISGTVASFKKTPKAYTFLSRYAHDNCSPKTDATAIVFCYEENYHTPIAQSCEPDSRFGTAHSCIGIFAVNWNKIDAENPQSLVLAIYLQSRDPTRPSYFRMIFPGDITGGAQQFMEKKLPPAWLQSTVYLFAHHGADTAGSNNAHWLSQLGAQVYISSASNHGICQHLRFSVARAIWHTPSIKSRIITSCGPHTLTLGCPPATAKFCNVQINQCILSTFNSGTILTETDGAQFSVTPEYPAGIPNGYPACPAL